MALQEVSKMSISSSWEIFTTVTMKMVVVKYLYLKDLYLYLTEIINNGL